MRPLPRSLVRPRAGARYNPAEERLVRRAPRWAQALVVAAARERCSGRSCDEFCAGCGAAQARRSPIRASSTEWSELVVDDDELVATGRGEAYAAGAPSGQFDCAKRDEFHGGILLGIVSYKRKTAARVGGPFAKTRSSSARTADRPLILMGWESTACAERAELELGTVPVSSEPAGVVQPRTERVRLRVEVGWSRCGVDHRSTLAATFGRPGTAVVWM